MTDLRQAKQALDSLIHKARVHFYKPIQIAEILYRDRTVGDIDLADLETYRADSKRWRDLVCLDLIGRVSTSTARYQDHLFTDTAIPPSTLATLGTFNRQHQGVVEEYICTS